MLPFTGTGVTWVTSDFFSVHHLSPSHAPYSHERILTQQPRDAEPQANSYATQAKAGGQEFEASPSYRARPFISDAN